ncbi:PAS domain S-box-containing protein [Desulfotomaculum arcticum]|uniref:histidine kinase n=1 Tax=Desulfotruncus arcticus DSM 17038 TaxID=1121424 RepID=A0A1I2PDF3_9FIRM|nr:ATP-binding protein [Desulfotruncus arcticus]SFG11987.1 PAS domain S-box-containing protein [Desulfotomaculum arcticum] [Desulfotruncus arcticus DSM 17038]
MRLGIEKRIMLPFLLLVIIPVLSVGVVSYLGSFNHLLANRKSMAAEELDNTAFALENLYQMSTDNGLSAGDLRSKTLEFLIENNVPGFFIQDGHLIGLPKDGSLDNEELKNVLPTVMLDIWEQGKGELPLEGKDFTKRYLVYRLIPGQNLVLLRTVQMDYLAPPLFEIQKYTILVALVGVILAVELTILIAHSLSRPIRTLANVCRDIGKGNLKPDLEIRRTDEVGILADSIRDMSQSLFEKNQQLLKIQRLNKEILKNTTTGILTTDHDGNIVTLNNTAVDILGTEDGSGSPILEEVLKLATMTIELRKPLHVINQIRDNQGSRRYIEVNTALFDDEMDQKGVVVSFQDVTQKRRIEERIETINRLTSLGELAAGLAHEIRNPLAGMKTSCQVLVTRMNSDPKNIPLLEGIQAEINRLGNLVTDLLSFARTTPTRITAVDIQEVIYHTKFFLDKQFNNNDITFLMHAPTNLPPVKADKDHLQQIFLNLFLNALKFMPGGGTLELTIEPYLGTENNLQVRVSDTGIGIAPEDLPKIFNPFFSTDPGGTGMGLSVVQKLVAENEGTIEVSSKPGRTTFTIQLPIMARG